MGYPLDLFLDSAQVHNEFLCSICQHVLADPILLRTCQHLFCTACLLNNEGIPLSGHTCPVDGSPFIKDDLVAPIRAFMNLLNGLRLKCEFKDCTDGFCLKEITSHIANCQHNPEAVKPCVTGCGAVIKNKHKSTHNCMTYLKEAHAIVLGQKVKKVQQLIHKFNRGMAEERELEQKVWKETRQVEDEKGRKTTKLRKRNRLIKDLDDMLEWRKERIREAKVKKVQKKIGRKRFKKRVQLYGEVEKRRLMQEERDKKRMQIDKKIKKQEEKVRERIKREEERKRERMEEKKKDRILEKERKETMKRFMMENQDKEHDSKEEDLKKEEVSPSSSHEEELSSSSSSENESEEDCWSDSSFHKSEHSEFDDDDDDDNNEEER